MPFFPSTLQLCHDPGQMQTEEEGCRGQTAHLQPILDSMILNRMHKKFVMVHEQESVVKDDIELLQTTAKFFLTYTVELQVKMFPKC